MYAKHNRPAKDSRPTGPLSKLTSLRPHWLPSTTAGWWAVGLEFWFVGFFGLMQLMVAIDVNAGTFFSNLWLAGTALAMAGSGIGGGLVALWALVRQRERSLLVVAAGVLGALVLMFIASELLLPH
ncbi:MAG: hypothetical protein H0T53_01130 [Herpetosiphonaceae bacterium]|nr:hypothetical protein [Herpetosiphonaceae bacterium]